MGRYTKTSPEWQVIRSNNAVWFEPSVMKFWSTRVYWQTLTAYHDGHLFVTAEDNYLRTERLFSVRFVNGDSIETLAWQEFDCLDRAREEIERAVGVAEWFSQAPNGEAA